MSSGSVAWPSATYRVASAAIVKVLPVPALASSTVVPVGRVPQTSNAAGASTEADRVGNWMTVIAAPHPRP
jgi:hypothetical protein